MFLFAILHAHITIIIIIVIQSKKITELSVHSTSAVLHVLRVPDNRFNDIYGHTTVL